MAIRIVAHPSIAPVQGQEYHDYIHYDAYDRSHLLLQPLLPAVLLHRRTWIQPYPGWYIFAAAYLDPDALELVVRPDLGEDPVPQAYHYRRLLDLVCRGRIAVDVWAGYKQRNDQWLSYPTRHRCWMHLANK